MAVPDVDPAVVKGKSQENVPRLQLFNCIDQLQINILPLFISISLASCKTYFETVRRGYRMAQDENKDKMEDSRIIMLMRQRK